MSFEQLMDHAYEIQKVACQWEVEFESRHWGDSGPTPHAGVNPADHPEVQALFADIPALFQPFADMPDPKLFEPLVDGMDRALGKLSWGSAPSDPINNKVYPANPDLDALKGAQPYIEDWTGEAAEAFVQSFITPFPSIEKNQFIVAAVLKASIEAYQAIWTTTRKDIDDLAENTLKALDNMDDCGKNQWPIGWTVAACIAGIMAAPLEGIAALTMGIVGTAAWVAAADPPAHGEDGKISGESPQAVINSMRQQISDLTKVVQQQTQRIAGAVTNAEKVVSDHPKLFKLNRPDLANANAGNITGPKEMGWSL